MGGTTLTRPCREWGSLDDEADRSLFIRTHARQQRHHLLAQALLCLRAGVLGAANRWQSALPFVPRWAVWARFPTMKSPAIKLVRPLPVEEAIQRMRTENDKYGFRERFRTCSVDELIAAFNGDVGNPGWVTARMVYLVALRDALLATGLDCSSFISDDGMSMARQVERRGNAIEPAS